MRRRIPIRGDVGRLLVVAAAAAVMAAGAGCGRGEAGTSEDASGQQVFEVRYSHVSTPESGFGQAAEIFKERVDELSGGRIKVEVFPNSTLYGQEDELQALQSGAVDMVHSTTSVMSTASPRFFLFDLPFVFQSEEDLLELVSPDSPIGSVFYDNPDLGERNMTVLGVAWSGFKQLTANRQIRTPDDMRGLKMRIQQSDVLRGQMRAWGANAVGLPFAELYNALQQGVVDGQENPYTSVFTTKVHEVQSDLTELDHGYNLGPIMVNTQFLESLPADLQDAMRRAGEDTTTAGLEYTEDINAEHKQAIEDAGTTRIYEPTESERKAWRDAVIPSLWDQYASKVGPELISALKDHHGM
jgi:C4-dicarboxylate-binding protein DctP